MSRKCGRCGAPMDVIDVVSFVEPVGRRTLLKCLVCGKEVVIKGDKRPLSSLDDHKRRK